MRDELLRDIGLDRVEQSTLRLCRILTEGQMLGISVPPVDRLEPTTMNRRKHRG